MITLAEKSQVTLNLGLIDRMVRLLISVARVGVDYFYAVDGAVRIRRVLLVALAVGWAAAALAGAAENLVNAATRGDVAEVRTLLDSGAEVNAKTAYGMTALMKASLYGHREVVQALLDKGADINAKANDGSTALSYAAASGRREVVQVLLDKGADVNAKSRNDLTALMMASELGYREVVQALLVKGADVNAKSSNGATALSLAAERGTVRALLLQAGANPDEAVDQGEFARFETDRPMKPAP